MGSFVRSLKNRKIRRSDDNYIYIKRNKLIMDKMNILKEIKSLIFSENKEEMAFKEAKVGDLIIRVEGDEFAEGQQVSIVTEDGLIPASPEMAGEHVLEDGTKLVLDEAGVIVSVEKAEAEVEAEVVEEEMAEEEVKVEETNMEEVKEEVKEEIKEELAEEVVEEVKEKVEEKLEEEKPEDDKVAELTSRIEALESAIEEMLALNKEVAEFSNAIKEKLETFVDETPAQLEFKSIKDTYKPTVKENKAKSDDRLESIRNFRMKK